MRNLRRRQLEYSKRGSQLGHLFRTDNISFAVCRRNYQNKSNDKPTADNVLRRLWTCSEFVEFSYRRLQELKFSEPGDVRRDQSGARGRWDDDDGLRG